ncbi:MAG: dihydrofolate reductase [Verrucomicrobiae bacterium]|nr:dihydrofolate reductase [Verrucomicrobiae bacterium]
MIVSLIAALASDRVIGSASGKIPWDHPRDRVHFRTRTAGNWLLVGRRTYDEMEGWFGKRIPIVLTRDPDFRPFSPAHRVARDPAAALALARGNGAKELIVCGGAEIFASLLPFSDRLLLTRLDLVAQVPDPVRFPDFSKSGDWKLAYLEQWSGDAENIAARYEVHERV